MRVCVLEMLWGKNEYRTIIVLLPCVVLTDCIIIYGSDSQAEGRGPLGPLAFRITQNYLK